LKYDSQAALDLIVDYQHNDFHPHTTILSLIKTLISSLDGFLFPQGNESANWLAKYGDDNIDTLKI